MNGVDIEGESLFPSYREQRTEGCKGYRFGNPSDGYDFDCEYEFSGEISCEDCIFGSCGGDLDPRVKREEDE